MDRLLDADTQVLSKDEYSAIAIDVQTKINALGQFGITYEKIRPYNEKMLVYFQPICWICVIC